MNRQMSLLVLPIALLASNPPATAHTVGDAASKAYSETVLHKFAPGGDGQTPYAGLVGDGSGNLYGATYAGGALGFGTVFKLTRSGSHYVESLLYSFAGGTDGSHPYGALIVDGTGALYGTTVSGGTTLCFGHNGCGIVFKLTPSGSNYAETVLYRFVGGGDGQSPSSALLPDASGSLYGTTSQGGSSACSAGCGTVYKLTPGGSGYTESILYAFQNGSDGAYPGTNASLIADASGALYGTTTQGGASAKGVVFKLTPTKSVYSESVLYAFSGGSDGWIPEAGLLADKTGALFGTTAYGGNTGCSGVGCGTVFELIPSGPSYTKRTLHIFADGKDGSYPNTGLIANSVGELYGTTETGGSTAPGAGGTVYALKRSGSTYVESVVFTFAKYLTEGSHPEGGVIADKAGDLYGTTLTGGISDPGCASTCGTVFRLKP